MKKTVGMMIKETLIEKHISQSTLGRGLCKKSDLSRYLNGTRRIDRLLLTVFLQRIGKSPAKFSLLLTEEEYVYFEWRHKISLAQMEGNWALVEQLLKENAKVSSLFNEVLQKQYTQIMQAIVVERLYHNREESIRLLHEAINMTVPGFHKGIKTDTLLGTQEICAILLWQRLQSDKMKSHQVLKELILYLDVHYQDVQELVKVYPKVVAQYLLLVQSQKEYETCLVLSEKVIDLMIKTGYANDMERFLQIYIEAAVALGVEEKVIKRKKQLQAWQTLMKDIGYESRTADDELFLLDVSQEIELLHEAITISRRERNYSQESLSQSICEPETISRIENGKTAPHQNTYKQLAKRLALPEECYFTTIETDDFEVLELQWWLESLMMRRQWDEAEEGLLKLRSLLNLENKRNKQYVEEKKYSIDRGKGKILLKDRLHQLTMMLQLTIPNITEEFWCSDKFWEHYFRKTEMAILIKVADVLFDMNEKVKAAHLLEAIIQYYKKRKVSYDLHYKTILLSIVRLTSVYSELGKYEKVLIYVDEGVKIVSTFGNKRLLGGLINNRAYALECLGKEEASLKYYKLAYYSADLMQLNSVEVSKEGYERLHGKSIEWY